MEIKLDRNLNGSTANGLIERLVEDGEGLKETYSVAYAAICEISNNVVGCLCTFFKMLESLVLEPKCTLTYQTWKGRFEFRVFLDHNEHEFCSASGIRCEEGKWEVRVGREQPHHQSCGRKDLASEAVPKAVLELLVELDQSLHPVIRIFTREDMRKALSS